ncbi:MAG: ATP-dependent RNA helicase RhlB [Gammaproteobacteria bacterium]|nr:ATP-dependent RNA helicase RhlB [Gammaproteobacteria bacterium]
MTKPHLTETAFDQLALAKPLTDGLQAAEFEFCTPIQAQTLPLALSGRDVAGQAQTGTGKTAAFLVACFQRLLTTEPPAARKPNDPFALILAPTRELAAQIHKDAVTIGKHCDFRLGLAFGGTDYQKQRDQLQQGVDILIGTPGRLIDFFKQKVFSLRYIQAVVLDEADRMFDLGFLKDIRYILRRLPAPDQRLNLLFSATLSHRVLELAYEHMNDPTLVKIETENVTADNIKQVIYYPSNSEKLPLLVNILKSLTDKRTMVFANTKRACEDIQHSLRHNKVEAEMISGDVRQEKRLRLLRDFTAGKIDVLVATDVAARGLHIPDVSHVVNFDLPDNPEDYVHRVGRTARAGASGDAISFACEDYALNLTGIEHLLGHKIDSEGINYDALSDYDKPPRRKRPQRHSSSHRRGKPRTSGRSRHNNNRRSKRHSNG